MVVMEVFLGSFNVKPVTSTCFVTKLAGRPNTAVPPTDDIVTLPNSSPLIEFGLDGVGALV